MGNSVQDLLQIMRSQLLQDPVVMGLVGDTILMHHSMDADAGTVPMPSVILNADIGYSMYNGVVQMQDIEIYAYSKISTGEALRVYDAVYIVLQSSRLILDNVDARGWMRETTRPLTGYNDRIKAWYARGRWVASSAG
jgi:hypothetical protein